VVEPVKPVPSTVTTHSFTEESKARDTDVTIGMLSVYVQVFMHTEEAHTASSESFKKTIILPVVPVVLLVKSESVLQVI
jgi:hypothetical protein